MTNTGRHTGAKAWEANRQRIAAGVKPLTEEEKNRPVEIHWDFARLCSGKSGYEGLDVKEFSPAWMQSNKEFYAELLDVVSTDYFAIEGFDKNPGWWAGDLCPHHFNNRTLGWKWAIHLAYPYTDQPGKVYKLSADLLLEKLDAKAEKKAEPSRIDELKEDIKDGLAHYQERKNEKLRVELIDDYRIDENGIWRILKNPKVIDGACLQIKNRDGKWETVDDLDGVIEKFVTKVEKGPAPLTHPKLQHLNEKQAAPISAGQKSSYPEMYQRVINGVLVNCL